MGRMIGFAGLLAVGAGAVVGGLVAAQIGRRRGTRIADLLVKAGPAR